MRPSFFDIHLCSDSETLTPPQRALRGPTRDVALFDGGCSLQVSATAANDVAVEDALLLAFVCTVVDGHRRRSQRAKLGHCRRREAGGHNGERMDGGSGRRKNGERGDCSTIRATASMTTTRHVFARHRRRSCAHGRFSAHSPHSDRGAHPPAAI